MTPMRLPRLDYLDSEMAALALSCAEEYLPKLLDMIATEPSKLAQTRYSSLSGNYESIAFFSYALGFPLEKVKAAFSQAAHAHLRVFELRGTEPVFPALHLRYDPAHTPGTPGAIVELKNLHEVQVDYSLTNSQKGYVAVCEALGACEDSVAKKIAALIWDPPNASYIGPKSFCTPNDQHLAYALRNLLVGGSIESELDQLKLSKSNENVGHQAMMLRALAAGDGSWFLKGLHELLSWHKKQASSKQNRLNPAFFICIGGLGLCRLAVTNKVCLFDDLPQGNVFLPLEMMQ